MEFNYRTKRGEKKTRRENLTEFVDVKGWKANGNKLGNYLRISGFKWIETERVDEISGETASGEELSLFN
jgi:hypothetical protein